MAGEIEKIKAANAVYNAFPKDLKKQVNFANIFVEAARMEGKTQALKIQSAFDKLSKIKQIHMQNQSNILKITEKYASVMLSRSKPQNDNDYAAIKSQYIFDINFKPIVGDEETRQVYDDYGRIIDLGNSGIIRLLCQGF